MQLDQTTIKHGGLMRCCLTTIGDYVAEHQHEQATEGFILDCKYERKGNCNIILSGGIWQWNRDGHREPQ